MSNCRMLKSIVLIPENFFVWGINKFLNYFHKFFSPLRRIFYVRFFIFFQLLWREVTNRYTNFFGRRFFGLFLFVIFDRFGCAFLIWGRRFWRWVFQNQLHAVRPNDLRSSQKVFVLGRSSNFAVCRQIFGERLENGICRNAVDVTNDGDMTLSSCDGNI